MHIKTIKGFSTLELLIAFAVMTLSITAVIMVAFGNQSNAIDTELAQRGLYIAQQKLEEAGAIMRNNFDGVTSQLLASAYDSHFDTQMTVTDISECAKRVKSETFWNRDLRELRNSLTMIVTSPDVSAALGADCATEEVIGWESPKFYDNPDPIHAGSQANDVDVFKNDKGSFAIIGSNKTGTHETFWILDVSNPDEPETIGKLDTGTDIYAVDAHAVGNVVYAYIATASTTAQMQIVSFDLTNYPTIDPTPTRIGKARLPGVAGSDPQGRAITYYDNKVYVGTRRTAGNEFHILNVSTPATPAHLGSLELNHSVNEIAIRNTNAYIASSATTAQGCELIVLNVSNPASLTNTCTPSSTSGVKNFRAPGNFGAITLEAFGDRVYLGRQRSGVDKDFYILNSTDLNAITSLGSLNLDINSGREVVGLKVSGDLAFVATTDTTPSNGGGPFLIYDISDPSTIVRRSLCEVNYSEGSTSMDLFENSIYITNSSNKALRIFYPSLSCS